MPDIYLCEGSSRFEEQTVDAETVGELRVERGLTTEAINVNRAVVNDDHQLRDNDRVAAVKTNKKGGK
tara:strand:+ start:1180 stop:1383 length:204 start_codon:yes stop_codon:yes gene_type:complete